MNPIENGRIYYPGETLLRKLSTHTKRHIGAEVVKMLSCQNCLFWGLSRDFDEMVVTVAFPRLEDFHYLAGGWETWNMLPRDI